MIDERVSVASTPDTVAPEVTVTGVIESRQLFRFGYDDKVPSHGPMPNDTQYAPGGTLTE